MLTRARRAAGFSLIELVVVVAIIGLLTAIAVPTFGAWSTNARIRATAEQLVAAVRLTEATAAAQSHVGVFALTNATPAYNATAAQNGSNWFGVVLPQGDETAAKLGTVVVGGASSKYGVTVTGPAALCFNSLGRVVAKDSSLTNIGASCVVTTDGSAQQYVVAKSGATSQFQVLVTPGGQVRMCDATKTLSTTNPDGC